MEENQEVKVPIYKTWWFWTIIILLILIIGFSSDISSKKNTATSSTIENSSNTYVSSYNKTSTNTINTTNNTISYEPIEEKKVEVTVADFSKMSQKEVKKWCDKNNIDLDIDEEYSSKVKKGNFISQSIKAKETIYEGDEITVIYSLGKEPTLGEKNALKKAHSYLNTMSFSYKRLIEQLEYEGFSKSEATYGADNCGADWYEQAAKKAESYMSSMSFSKSRLIEQLEYEGFTKKQAQYGAKSVGY